MDELANALTLEFLTWISARRRTYRETMEAWRTSCRRHSIWEDALIAGLIQVEGNAQEVVLTLPGQSPARGHPVHRALSASSDALYGNTRVA